MRETGISVQVQLSSLDGIDVMLDGQLIDLGSNRKERMVPTEKATIIVTGDRKNVSISFASGFSFVFTRVENSLTLVSMADVKNKGKTRGLLGTFDGHPENDLQTPDGVVIPLSSSLKTIHYDFGLKWMITKAESFFTYGKDKSYDTYKNEQFQPSFTPPDPRTMPSDVVEMCEGEFECLYDYATTKNIALANHTLMTAQKYNQTIQIFSQNVDMCPAIKAPENGYMNATNFFVDQIATFGCFNGYKLIGNTEVKCTEEKKWTGQPPVCANEASSTPTTVNTTTTVHTTTSKGFKVGPLAMLTIGTLIAIII
jgi:hypothetical protein